MAGHAQLKIVMTECSKTQIRLTGLIYSHVVISTRLLLVDSQRTVISEFYTNHVKTFQTHVSQWFDGKLFLNTYRKNPKISDTRKLAVITLKVEQDGFSLE